MSEIIYILTNPAIPNLIKIGMTTTNLEQRVRELSRASGVPLPFEIFYAAEVADAKYCEWLLHNAFIDKRINPKREFFSISPEQVVSAIKLAEITNITPSNDIVDSVEEWIALDEAKKMRERTNLHLLDIPVWATLHFINDFSITCTVTDNSRVILFWENMSLSEAASKVFEKLWNYKNYPLQWTTYWLFENETIRDRRLRLENWE